jgi:hypothetical protein
VFLHRKVLTSQTGVSVRVFHSVQAGKRQVEIIGRDDLSRALSAYCACAGLGPGVVDVSGQTCTWTLVSGKHLHTVPDADPHLSRSQQR